jgi:hypothetical protein
MKIKEYIHKIISEELEQYSTKEQINKIINIKEIVKVDLQGGFYDGLKYTIYDKPIWLLKAAGDYCFLQPNENLDIHKNDVIIVQYSDGKNYGSLWYVRGIFTDLEKFKHQTRDFGKRTYVEMIVPLITNDKEKYDSTKNDNIDNINIEQTIS